MTALAFSVLTRTTGRRTELARALESVRAQTFSHDCFELVLVNDGGPSVADLAADAREHFTVELLEHPASIGKSAAINSGFDLSRGRHVCILDDDDVYYSAHLEILRAAIEETPDVPVLYTDTDIAVVDGGTRHVIGTQSWEFDRGELMMLRRAPVTCSVCVRREAWSAVEGFDDHFSSVLDDWDFYMRLSARFAFRRVPRTTSQYTQPSGNKSFERFLAFEAGIGRIRAGLGGTTTELKTGAALDEAMDRMRRDYALAEREFQIDELRRQAGSKPQDIALAEPQISVVLAEDGHPARVKALGTTCFEIEITNRGTERWCSNGGRYPIFLSYHWLTEGGGEEVWDGIRTPLPRDVPAGDVLRARVLVHAPERPGEYRWSPALVQEGVQWFDLSADALDQAQLVVLVDR